MDIKETLVTPQMAEAWLKKNTNNRPLRMEWVRQLAALMKAGEFTVTHQSVAIDKRGYLADGQHRLHAVVLAGISVRMMVARGCALDTYKNTDGGIKRTVADRMRIPQKQAEVVTMAARIALGRHPLPSELSKIFALMSPVMSNVLDGCAARAKVFSTAPIKLAAVTRVLMGEDASYVQDVYRALVLGKIEALPPVAQSMVGQYMRGALNTGDKSDLLARGLTVFKKRSGSATKLQVKDSQLALEAVREFYSEALAA